VLALRTEELADFREQLDCLLQTLTGEAVLTHMEAQVGCTVRLSDGVGDLDAFLREEIGAELQVSQMRTDQSYLHETLAQMHSLTSAFPVRGDPLR
jgi:hypothetical protein